MGIIYKAGSTYVNKMIPSDLSLLVEKGKKSEMHIYYKQALDLLGTEQNSFKNNYVAFGKNDIFFLK